MPKVTMYSTRFCPYCVRARMLLERKGVTFDDIRIDSEPNRREEMIRRASGSTSVPQIFIDDEHVGGCDDLYELDFDGELDQKLGLASSQ